MRTYIYVYHKCRAMRDDPTPPDRVTVYRLKKNVPELVGIARTLIGYRDTEQAVCDIILDNERGWDQRYNKPGVGSCNPVHDAVRNQRFDDPGKRAQLFRV